MKELLKDWSDNQGKSGSVLHEHINCTITYHAVPYIQWTFRCGAAAELHVHKHTQQPIHLLCWMPGP